MKRSSSYFLHAATRFLKQIQNNLQTQQIPHVFEEVELHLRKELLIEHIFQHLDDGQLFHVIH